MSDRFFHRVLLTGLVSGLLMTGGCSSMGDGPTGSEDQTLKPPIAPRPLLVTSPLDEPTSTPPPRQMQPVPTPTPPPEPPVYQPAPTPTDFQEYTVQKGDTLYRLSRRFYGNNTGWRKIYEANQDQIPNPDGLLVGMTLRIPQ